MNYKEKAIELLGKEKVVSDLYMGRDKAGYNQMHSKAVEVVVGLLKYKEAVESAEGESPEKMARLRENIISLIETTTDK